jgi:hypothetical protein
MKTKIFLGLLGAVLAGAGCVNTVSDRTTAGVPLLKDQIKGRYEKSVDQVYEAAKDVMKTDGALVHEGTVYNNQTNSFKVVEGKVNQRSVYIRIEPEDAKVTAVTVQARTKAGGPDVALAAQLDKEIALKLAGR